MSDDLILEIPPLQYLLMHFFSRFYKWLLYFSVYFAVVFSAGCAPRAFIPPSSSESWDTTAAPNELRPDQKKLPTEDATVVELPQSLPVTPQIPLQVSLGDLIDLGLQTSPLTKATWSQSRIGLADVGIAQSSYYPQIETGYQEIRRQSQALVPNAGQEANTRTVSLQQSGPYVSANYLLYDFGAREASVARARYDLIAASFDHNRAVQQVVVSIQDAFFQYISLIALAEAQEQSVHEARRSLEAAEARRAAGVATRADMLQAKTELARAELELETRRGNANAVKGAVLTAVGLSPTQPVTLQPFTFPRDLDAESYSDIEALIATATEMNPELLAARARVESAQENVTATRRGRLPSLRFNGRYDRLEQSGVTLSPYSATLNVSIPLFTGFARSEQITKSEAQLELAKAGYQEQLQARMEALWRQHALFQSARKQLGVSEVLVLSATESLEVADGRYQEGVGTILDLLQAQRLVEEARASRISAQANWLLSLAQLRFQVGSFTTTTAALTEK